MRPAHPPATCSRRAVAAYKRADISFSLAFAGHGVGYAIHETPMLAADDDTPLQPGMFFALETRVRWPGQAGYHIEDAVLITEDGPELVTSSWTRPVCWNCEYPCHLSLN